MREVVGVMMMMAKEQAPIAVLVLAEEGGVAANLECEAWKVLRKAAGAVDGAEAGIDAVAVGAGNENGSGVAALYHMVCKVLGSEL